MLVVGEVAYNTQKDRIPTYLFYEKIIKKVNISKNSDITPSFIKQI